MFTRKKIQAFDARTKALFTYQSVSSKDPQQLWWTIEHQPFYTVDYNELHMRQVMIEYLSLTVVG